MLGFYKLRLKKFEISQKFSSFLSIPNMIRINQTNLLETKYVVEQTPEEIRKLQPYL